MNYLFLSPFNLLHPILNSKSSSSWFSFYSFVSFSFGINFHFVSDKNSRSYRQMVGQTDSWTYKRVDGWMDGRSTLSHMNCKKTNVAFSLIYNQFSKEKLWWKMKIATSKSDRLHPVVKNISVIVNISQAIYNCNNISLVYYCCME